MDLMPQIFSFTGVEILYILRIVKFAQCWNCMPIFSILSIREDNNSIKHFIFAKIILLQKYHYCENSRLAKFDQLKILKQMEF